MIETAQAPAERAAARLDTLVPRLVETRRRIAGLRAEEARLLAEADAVAGEWAATSGSRTSADAELAHRSVAAEIAAAWRVSDRTVQRQLAYARTLHDFPDTLAALSAGRISYAHVRTIVDAGERIEQPELRAEYEAAVVPYAETVSAARLAPIARRRADWFTGQTMDERHALARAGRRVTVTDLEDGMAELVALLPSVLAHGALDRLTRLARADADAMDGRRATGTAADGTREVCAAGDLSVMTGADRTPPGTTDADGADDRRSLDERRADVLADLLLTSDPVAHSPGPSGLGAVRAVVQVTVPVLALLGGDAADPFEPVSLTGGGPIDVATARALAADAPGWDRVLTHPVTGAVLGVDRYRPSEEIRRYLRVRDVHCRFPGCRMSTAVCDVDHTVDRQYDGATDTANLAHLCRRHHVLKHRTGWRVRQRAGALLEWTSPTGRRYIDAPSSAVYFSGDPECDPVHERGIRGEPPPF